MLESSAGMARLSDGVDADGPRRYHVPAFLFRSPQMPADDVEKIRGVLLGAAQNDPGKQALGTLGYKGFVPTSQDDELKAIVWLGL